VLRHFVQRGFDGKAMLVSIDKKTAVLMPALVLEEWSVYLTKLRPERGRTTQLERAGLDTLIELMMGGTTRHGGRRPARA